MRFGHLLNDHVVSLGFHGNHFRRINQQDSALGFDRNPHGTPSGQRLGLWPGLDAAVAQVSKISVTAFIGVALREVHLDPLLP